MTREDEYTLTLSSGKIVMLISGLLCAMLACFVTGLVIGRSPQLGSSGPQLDVAAPSSSPQPELSRADQPAPKVSLPEIPAVATAPAKQETKVVAKKTETTTTPRSAPAPSVSTSGARYTICVLSARNKDGAETFARQLRESGYKASVMRTETNSGTVWYRTVIGEFSSRDAAKRQLAALRKKSNFADAFIIMK